MQIKIFSIPIGGDDVVMEEMNHFLRANKIIDVTKSLGTLGSNSCWTFCVTYLPDNRPEEPTYRHGSSEKVDYKEVLEPVVFERFSALRKVRKQVAADQAIPAYAVFTDAELAELAKVGELTLSAMQGIPGIGKKKVEKYGEVFVASQKEETNEAGGTPDGKDSGA